MKRVLFFVCIVSATGSMAQQKDVFDIEKHLKLHKPTNFYPVIPQTFISIPAFAAKVHQELFYSLPQDNMPCIVPDMNQFNMPVVTGKSAIPSSPASPGAIPNPATPLPYPFNITPGKKN